MQSIKASARVPEVVLLDSDDPDYNLLSSLHLMGHMPNSEQWRAVTTDAQRMLIHAGAGSGKTTTLMWKIMYLLKQKRIAPQRVLLLTFMRKSAEDMKARMANMIPEARKVHAGTFHSVFGNYLIRQGMTDLYSKRLLKDQDRQFLIMAAMRDAGTNHKEVPVEDVATFITLLKNTGVEPDEAVFEKDRKLGEVYWYYESLRERFNRMDFDDIITAFSPYATEFGQNYDAILVDEFQDISTTQRECLMKMANEHNIFVGVGDSEQAIYSFRGGNIASMTEFERYFPHASIVEMGTNYRSHSQIVQCGLNVVRNNKNRRKVELYGIRDSENNPILLRPKDNREEAVEVVGYLREAMDEVRPSEIAVLFRNGYYAEPLISELIKERIPFRLESDSFTIYDKPIVRSVMAMMRAAKNPDNIELIKQFGYLCYLGKDQLLSLKDVAEAQGTSSLDAIPHCEFRYGNQKARQLVRAIKYASPKPQKAVDDLLEWYLGDFLENQGLTGRLQLEELDFFKEAVSRHKDIDEIYHHANELRQEIEKAQHLKEDVDALVLSTIHRAKGLEWPVVFVIGVVDGVLFDNKSEDIEEERRLCYVAVTRAKEHLIVSSPQSYGGKQSETSFVKEMQWVEQTKKEPR